MESMSRLTQNMEQAPQRLVVFLVFCILSVMVVAAFWQVRYNDFLYYDDPQYITQNPHVQAGLTLDGIRWAFTSFDAYNWFPMTWLSHMLDCHFFGLDPKAHHLTSLGFHLINTLFLFWVLKQMTGALWRSALVGALFAVHPLHVESVVWASERKDLLSTFFWILTIGSYLFYVKKPQARRYLLVMFCFSLGLMAKPMLVTLPFMLL